MSLFRYRYSSLKFLNASHIVGLNSASLFPPTCRNAKDVHRASSGGRSVKAFPLRSRTASASHSPTFFFQGRKTKHFGWS